MAVIDVERNAQPSQPEGDAAESVGEFAAACLRANGVSTVFGIPGTHNIEIYRGLQRYGIRHILTRHEQGAVYAADGYARATGRPGVVVATSGPGVTNCITGIANAYADSIPVLVLSPGPARGEERRDLGFLHEAKDQRSGMDNFAGRSVRVESREALEQAIHGAFLSWRTDRARPVHVEIPTDLIAERSPVAQTSAWQGAPPVPAAEALSALIGALQDAVRPIIIAGGGCLDHSAALTAFVDATQIPVVTTLQGKGSVDERHPLACGALAGSTSGFAPVARADLILALGTELKSAEIARHARVARFDIDPAQLHKHHVSALPVLGDVGAALTAMLAHPGFPEMRLSSEWRNGVLAEADALRSGVDEEWAVLHQAIVGAAEGTSKTPTVLTGDSSQISWLGTTRSAVLDGPRQFLSTDGFATLGYGLPAAIGAKLARPDAAVVGMMGDGALMFSVQELATASEIGLSLPVVVFDNGGYAEIRKNMGDAGIVPIAVDLARPDYPALAAAFHCGFEAPATPSQLAASVREALTAERPTVIVVDAGHFAGESWRLSRSISPAERGRDGEEG